MSAAPVLPVVVIGAGPVGLAAAAHLSDRGLRALVLEAGHAAGTAVREWAHVRLFSTWGEVVDPAAEKVLAPMGWSKPDAATYPSGGDWAEHYLQPLADALGDRVRYGARVTGVSKAGRDRIVDTDRESQPFVVHVRHTDGREERILAAAVIDASGTWTLPSPAGGSGLPALSERAAADRISYRVPDLTDPAVRARYSGKRTAVIGSGASAFTALSSLAELSRSEDGTDTKAVWVLRRGISGSTFGGGDADQLPARGALGLAAKAAVDDGHAEAVTGFRTKAVESGADGGLVLVAEDGRRLETVDEIIVLTGLRPDLSFLSEVRLRLDERLEAPVELAPLIDPNQHSCGTVYPHGHRELSHPDAGVYLVGMKSYGRAPTFLAMTGYEQVRSVAAALAGDADAADRVELVLPETGVCGGLRAVRHGRHLPGRSRRLLRTRRSTADPAHRRLPRSGHRVRQLLRRLTATARGRHGPGPRTPLNRHEKGPMFPTQLALGVADLPATLLVQAGQARTEETDTACRHSRQDKLRVCGSGPEPREVCAVEAGADAPAEQPGGTGLLHPRRRRPARTTARHGRLPLTGS